MLLWFLSGLVILVVVISMHGSIQVFARLIASF